MLLNAFNIVYDVDVVLCIDATGSMVEAIEEIKDKALDFPMMLSQEMEIIGKQLDKLRVKVISFRDLNEDGADAICEEGFFTLPDKNEDFEKAVMRIRANGGGDDPENALDAIALAMKSDWCETGFKRRHVVVVYTDAPSLKLDDGRKHVQGAPKNLDELHDWWDTGVPDGSFEPRSGRLVLFAPDDYPWNLISGWNRTDYYPSIAGGGCEEFDLRRIAKSVSRGCII